jgi:hypothetical protein
MISPGKTPADIETLRALSPRYSTIIHILHIIYLIVVILITLIIHKIVFLFRLLNRFKYVFPYCNKVNSLIMDTENVHFIKHCHVDVKNYANPMNCCWYWPKGGHKTWVHQQGLRANQGNTSAQTIMPYSLNKKASQLLCDAMRCRIADGNASAENWKDSNGRALAPDCFWNTAMESMIAATMQALVWALN